MTHALSLGSLLGIQHQEALQGSEEERQGTERSHKTRSLKRVTAVVSRLLIMVGTLQASGECGPQNFSAQEASERVFIHQ